MRIPNLTHTKTLSMKPYHLADNRFIEPMRRKEGMTQVRGGYCQVKLGEAVSERSDCNRDGELSINDFIEPASVKFSEATSAVPRILLYVSHPFCYGS